MGLDQSTRCCAAAAAAAAAAAEGQTDRQTVGRQTPGRCFSLSAKDVASIKSKRRYCTRQFTYRTTLISESFDMVFISQKIKQKTETVSLNLLVVANQLLSR